MNKRYLLSLSFAGLFATASSPAVVAEYIKIQEKLAADSTEGVTDAAKKIASLEKKSKVAVEAEKLAAQKDIKTIRNQFKVLSTEVIASTPKAELKDVKIAGCPMANAKWLQKDGPIRNPYFGASMLECGGFE